MRAAVVARQRERGGGSGSAERQCETVQHAACVSNTLEKKRTFVAVPNRKLRHPIVQRKIEHVVHVQRIRSGELGVVPTPRTSQVAGQCLVAVRVRSQERPEAVANEEPGLRESCLEAEFRRLFLLAWPTDRS